MSRRGEGRSRRRAVEACKSLIIVLLLLSVVLLAMTAAWYSGSVDWGSLSQLTARLSGQTAIPPRQDAEPALTDAAQPVAVTVLGSAGRASFHGDFAALDGAFESLGSLLAAALDTASDARELTDAALRAAATEPGIGFYYPGEMPLAVLAAWLDADASELNLSGSFFLLTEQSGAVELLLSGEGGGWRLTTEANVTAFRDVLDDYPADGTFLAAESEAFRRVDGLTLVDPAVTAVAAAEAVNPHDDAFLTATATALGFNPYGETTYQDDTGTVYTETDCTLHIAADGVLTLRNQGLSARFAAAADGDSERVEYVRSLLESLAGAQLGDARLYFTGLEQAEGETVVTFSYYLAGRPVEQPQGTAVRAVFQGRILSELTFRIRTYTLSGTETIALMPAAQMAAVAPAGLRLEIGYADTGDTALSAGWLRQGT